MLSQLSAFFPHHDIIQAYDEITLILERDDLLEGMRLLQNDPSLSFTQLMDVTAVDYLQYQCGDWTTESAHNTGYSRARKMDETPQKRHRFAVVYHLLSQQYYMRVRIQVFLEDEHVTVPSVGQLWPSALWAEREVFDLFGIVFTDHPHLARILTDDHFQGHPLRKDFPLSGNYDVRYDATQESIVRETTTHVARVDIPKVIRIVEG